MENSREPLQQLTEIRDLMERSSRFISLSGLSGISAGIIALAGSAIAFFYLGYDQRYFTLKPYTEMISGFKSFHPWLYITLDAMVMLILPCHPASISPHGGPGERT
jgi:hypothetical protein